ncbi:IS66 family transposase [Corallococcus sp. M34]|nr:IS66 family transposase [Citreicoccus inhibens]MBU8901061.1 IS66 family transposase [Citreicoccus inhibens]
MDHHCPWREEAEELRERLTALEQQVATLTRTVFGKKSEKLPPPAEELRKEAPRDEKAKAEAALLKRRERAGVKKELPSRTVFHPVPRERQRCPRCNGTDFHPMGPGRPSVLYEYIPGRFEKQVHVRETLVCACGESVVTALGPPRVAEKTGYGSGFIAHLVTSKCADSLPLHRLEKALAREGLPVARSTMTDLFHRAATELAPVSDCLLKKVAMQQVVQADETPLKVQAPEKTRTGYLWTFLSEEESSHDSLVAYCFSPTRAGTTPMEVLGSTRGALVVDAYTGYNRVTTPEGRTRVGCWAHVRRRFFEACPHPSAQEMLKLILQLYRVEAAVKEAGLARTSAHLAMRKEQSSSALAAIRSWLEENKPLHPPRGPLGTAITYAIGQWDALTRFVDDVRLPLDNNASERALRVAALGRKNFLFVGHDHAGHNLAGLYSLVATCSANGINPREYLSDVLLRVQYHPASRLDELLPGPWSRRLVTNTS